MLVLRRITEEELVDCGQFTSMYKDRCLKDTGLLKLSYLILYTITTTHLKISV